MGVLAYVYPMASGVSYSKPNRIQGSNDINPKVVFNIGTEFLNPNS